MALSMLEPLALSGSKASIERGRHRRLRWVSLVQVAFQGGDKIRVLQFQPVFQSLARAKDDSIEVRCGQGQCFTRGQLGFIVDIGSAQYFSVALDPQ